LRIPARNLIVRSHLESSDVHYQILPVPGAARSKACACGRWLGGIIGFEIRRDGWLCFWVMCVARWRSLRRAWSLVQGTPSECGVSEHDREALTMRRPWPTGGCRAIKMTRCCQNSLCENAAWWCGPDKTGFFSCFFSALKPTLHVLTKACYLSLIHTIMKRIFKWETA
jgi:hypothetical protein